MTSYNLARRLRSTDVLSTRPQETTGSRETSADSHSLFMRKQNSSTRRLKASALRVDVSMLPIPDTPALWYPLLRVCHCRLHLAKVPVYRLAKRTANRDVTMSKHTTNAVTMNQKSNTYRQ